MVAQCYISVRDFSYHYLCNGFLITVITDIPCHLYMRWSAVKPQKHIVPVERRGLYMHGDVYLCFVAYTDNEQEEAGDTLTHTFIKRNWPVCETRYFHFWGKVAGVACPSTTALFELHFNIVHLYLPSTPSNRDTYQTNALWPPAHDAPTGTILAAYGPPWYMLHTGQELTVNYHIYRTFLFFNTSALSPTIDIADGFLWIYVDRHWRTSSAIHPNLCITQGVQHDPVVPADYGAQLPYTTIGGQHDLAALIDNQYNAIPLNLDGAGFINPGSITKLCLRGEGDIANATPPLGSNIAWYRSQQWPTDKPPLLQLCLPPS